MKKILDSLPRVHSVNVSTNSNLPTPPQQMTFTVDELLTKIDQIKNVGFGHEPGFFEGLFSPGARDLKRIIEEAKASAVLARKELIDGLSSCIVVYIDTHKADLKIRGAAFVTTTFATLTGKLNQIVESVTTSFFETYSKMVDDYERIPNLTETVRQELCRRALGRAMAIADLNSESFFEILNNLKDQVIKLSNEIGRRE
jgi:hypothetical protein